MIMGAISVTSERVEALAIISVEMGAFGVGSLLSDLVLLHWDDTIVMHTASRTENTAFSRHVSKVGFKISGNNFRTLPYLLA